MQKKTDNELIILVQQGQDKAFDVLVNRYYSDIILLANSIVHDNDEAKDIAQTTFIKAFKYIGTFKPGSTFFNWLYRITINESINLIKKNPKSTELDENQKSEIFSPEEVYRQTMLSSKVEDALMGMNINSRALLVLRYFADMSYKELSFVFEKPEKTIKSRLYDAKQNLSKHLKRNGLSKT